MLRASSFPGRASVEVMNVRGPLVGVEVPHVPFLPPPLISGPTGALPSLVAAARDFALFLESAQTPLPFLPRVTALVLARPLALMKLLLLLRVAG